jgi:hypothetical protein
MEPHQPRVVSTVSITQQIPADPRFAYLAVETQPSHVLLLRGLLAISRVGDGVMLTINNFTKN